MVMPVRMRGVRKSFGEIEALRGIDLEVRQGEVVALLGPNGAGKTTALDILLGRRQADEGESLLFGADPALPSSRRTIGATPQFMDFPMTLRVREIVDLIQVHFANPAPPERLMQEFGLSEVEQRQTGGLSGGERRRLAVALAFCGDPEAVFLDEPTTGLDVESRRAVWEAIREHATQGRTVLLSTHYLDEAEALASRIVVISRGQIKADGKVSEIKAIAGGKEVRFKADSVPDYPGMAEVRRDGSAYTVHPNDADEYVSWLVRERVRFTELEVVSVSLEEAFLKLTGGETE